ncbi:MAG: oligosaccharide flippase family protein [Oscillospiraceae bacterium]
MGIGGMKKLALDTALLTGASIVMRCIGLLYQVWLAGRIGSAGLGLFQLISSVTMLSVTLAISGIRFTTTRLVAEELGAGAGESVGRALLRCGLYAAFFGGAALLILFFGAEPIGFLWIGDARTVLSLKIISFSLPMVALSSVFNGYFIAAGRAYKSAVIQVLEQLINIGCVVLFLSGSPENDLEKCCASISAGNVAADLVSLLLAASVFALDRRKHGCRGGDGQGLTGRMLRIAVPLALSAYARTSLTTLENLLVPRKLRSAGLSADGALSGYGTITGMVYPIITFPSCLLSAMAELSIPELTAAQVSGDRERIDRTVSSLLRLTLVFSLACAAFLFLNAEPLGMLIYQNREVGRYIRIFAFVLPVMYMDIVTDGCLKGLGQMMYSMSYNIAEAFLGVFLVITILPRHALKGYIFVLFFSEVFNFVLSIGRLKKVCGFRLFGKAEKTKNTAVG